MMDYQMELRLLNVNETEMEKKLKKIIFLFISIVFPLFEFISLSLQLVSMYNTAKQYDIFIFSLSFISFLCTISMMGVCYDKSKCVVIMIIVKTLFIILLLLISTYSQYFGYYLVFNVIGYGIFYTLIFVYKSFKKGFI